MVDLTNQEKRNLEKLFGMGSGFVLVFSNRTFGEFVLDSTGKDIFDESYNRGSAAKANRPGVLDERGEPPRRETADRSPRTPRKPMCSQTARLSSNLPASGSTPTGVGPVVEIEAIMPITDDATFAALAKSVKESIAANKPETGLDRLHTFVTKYMRVLCERHVEMASSFPHHSANKNTHPAEGYSSFFDVMRYDSPERENIFE